MQLLKESNHLKTEAGIQTDLPFDEFLSDEKKNKT